MKKIFLKIIKSPFYILWFFLTFGLIYYSYDMILSVKQELMLQMGITDNIYLFYSYLMPNAFYDGSMLFSFLLEFSYLSIILYVSIKFVDFIFIAIGSSIVPRIERKKLIKSVMILNIIYSIIIFLIFIFLLWYFFKDIKFELTNKILIVTIYKLLFTISLTLIYTYFYIQFDSSFLSMIFLFVYDIIIGILLNILFNLNKLKFNFSLIIILFFVLINITLYKLIIKLFERRDV